MICKVLSTIERYHMLKKGATVIIALSGGADSMALLTAFNTIRVDYNLKLIAAHVNHGLRGEEALRDEHFVINICDRLGIELRVLHSDINTISAESGEGIEECGRRIRYGFFNSICEYAVIATAHTLSDCLETMLFNLARGSTLKGLCGIPAVRDNIIRPLIECSRADIEEYCKENDILFVTDSTNSEDKYSRNRIRHNIVPQLEKINPLLNEAILRCSLSLIEDEELLCRLSEELLYKAKVDKGYKVDILINSPAALRKRVISSILFNITGIAAENKHIQAVDDLLLKGGKLQILKGTIVRVRAGTLDFPGFSEKSRPWSAEFNTGLVKLPYDTVEITIVNRKDLEKIQKIHKDILAFCIDYDKIIGNAFFRSRSEGDKIRLGRSNCTKSLKKLFNEKGIPPEDRNKVVLISDDFGLLWIEGIGCAERCALSEGTEKIMIINVGRSSGA